MITLAAGNTVQAVASANTAVNYTITGMEQSSANGEVYKSLAQGTLTNSPSVLYTVPASTAGFIKKVLFTETSGTNRTVSIYVNGSSNGNRIYSVTIPANGSASYDEDGWHVYDSNGVMQYVGGTGPTGATGTAATVAAGSTTTTAPGTSANVTNVGSSSAATFNFSIPAGSVWRSGSTVPSNGTGLDGDFYLRTTNGDVYQRSGGTYSVIANITGPTGATGPVSSVTAGDTSITIGGTASAPTVAVNEANLSGIPESGVTNLTTDLAAKAPNARLINTTAPLTGGGDLSADRTLAISAATTSAAGSQSALDKKKQDNMYYDVTAWSSTASNNLVGDDSTDNSARWSALFAALPVGATVFFPAGTYRTSTEFTISADKHLRIIGAGMYSATIKTTSTTANIFHINGSYWYNTFENLRFDSTVTKTAGAAISIDPGSTGSAVGTNIFGCSFINQFIAVDAQGSQAANNSFWRNLDIAATPVNGRGIRINGDTINLTISQSTINCGYPPFQVAGTACIEINQSGAVQMVGLEVIGGTNTLLLNANQGGTTSVAAVYATNSFFDQSAGSTVKITGANIVNRCKFVQCGITTGNTGVTGAIAVEIASSGTGAAGGATAAADGIDFFDCDVYPNGITGTVNGFQVTGAQGVTINACRISGFTNAITVTPAAANGYTKLFVTNNKIGATNNFTTPNTNGLVLNAGSFQYGAIVVAGNDFTGSTTPLVENATVAFSWQELYEGNIGITNRYMAPVSTANQAFASGATGLITGGTIPIPTNGLRVGNTFRWTFPVSKTAAGTSITFGIKFGTANSAADANIATAAFTGTAAADAALVTITFVVTATGASATGVAYCQLDSKLAATGWVTTATGTLVNMTMTAFNSTVTSPYLNIAITANTATVPTVQAPVTAEILR